ncbi:hypothetical protein RND81_08G223700 [Saponaria officinalis]|uniref:Uncharacterized protein n=2 Tax=Saponaria officinalis TaxID=3572 RepID=A0AAW1J9Y8_SAPOF
MGSVGRITIRSDHLESDLLMQSTCSISEWGIGGPLVDNISGDVIGMDFFCRKKCTPFLPGNILLKCIDQSSGRGIISFPWAGWKTRPLHELKADELEIVFSKYKSFEGVIIKDAMQLRVTIRKTEDKVIRVQSFSPPTVDRWPLLPPPLATSTTSRIGLLGL